MEIYDSLNQLLLDVIVDDTSYRYRTIGGDHNLILKYSLAEHIELPVGAYVMYDGRRYNLKRPEDFKMQHARCYDYTVTFESPQFDSKVWKFRNTDGRLKFSLTAKPHEHLQMFVDNMNRRGSGWSVGDCIEASEKLINYDHDYCWDALGKMASEFNTEFEIADKRVSLRKVEYNRNNPLPLSYGMGNGFKTGVGRSNCGDKPPVEILFVQGGTDNIDPSTYGSKELKLPAGLTIAFDGQHFEGEEGYQASAARRYIVDDQGLSIHRADKALSSQIEDSLDASQIYPKRVGKVTQVIEVNKAGNLYDFADSTIPADLDFEDCLIEGETMTVIFQSGMLAGREFEVKYIHNSVKGKAARRFELVPQEIDGETMPNEVFKPVENDTYAVFKCALPQGYIRDDTTKTGASWDMFREAVKYLYDNEEAKFSFTGTLDGLWAKKDWLNVGGRLILGGCVLFRSEDFLPDGTIVRIVGIKDFINNPHSPAIELSNETKSSSFGTDMANLESQEVHVDDNYRSALQFTKRRFRDATETMRMLEQALLDNFTNSINPIAVHTMQMIVGDESLQFRFVNSKTEPNNVPHLITYDNALQQLTAEAGVMQHLTLGINTLSSSHKASEYHFWDVSAYTSGTLDNPDIGYYLYIKANRTTQYAEFILSETSKKFNEDDAVYYFLVGILNKEYDGARSFVSLYGFTEVLPGRISTDKIVSSNGLSYFDLANNEFNLGGLFSLNNNSGLWLRSKMILGDTDADGNNLVWAGHNGLYQTPKTIASFWGGPMTDRFYDADGNKRVSPLTSGYAASLVRMDGSYYFCNGNIGGNPDGSGWLGNYENGIKFDSHGGITFGSGINITIGSGDSGLSETLSSLVTAVSDISRMLEWVPDSSLAEGGYIRAKANFASVGEITAMGAPGNGGTTPPTPTKVSDLQDVNVAGVANGMVLVYRNGYWVAETPQSGGIDTVQLASYLSQNNYVQQSALDDYVTRNTAQEITGQKTFTAASTIVNKILRLDGSGLGCAMDDRPQVLLHIPNLAYSKFVLGDSGTVHLLKSGATDFNSYEKLMVGSIARYGGTSSQFLKADGSVDGNSYLTSHQALDYINIKDIRDTTPTPNAMASKKVMAWFNNTDKPGANPWYSGLTVQGWNSNESYAAWQLSSTASVIPTDKNLYFRVGAGSAWDSWQKILTSENYTSALDDRYVHGNYIKCAYGVPTLQWEWGTNLTHVVGFNSYDSAAMRVYGGEAVRNFANAVNKSGDTMTGNLTINGTNANLQLGNFISWGGVNYPTIISSSADKWVMMFNPHIAHGNMNNLNAAVIRMASNSAYTNQWDLRAGNGDESFIIARRNNTGDISKHKFTDNAQYINGNTVWHSGNDGAGSGLDADLLDGLHGSDYVRRQRGYLTAGASQSYLEWMKGHTDVSLYAPNQWSWALSGIITTPWGDDYPINTQSFSAFTFRQGNISGAWAMNAVLFLPAYCDGGNATKFMYIGQARTSDTAQLIGSRMLRYADYDTILASNVASATKLANTRTIWGQNFNGEGNVDGVFKQNCPAAAYTNNAFFGCSTLTANQVINITFGKAQSPANIGYIGHKHIADGSNQNMIVFGGHSYDQLMSIRYDGVVMIGTTTPVAGAKLHVQGNIYSAGEVTATNTSDMRLKRNIMPIQNAIGALKALGGYYTFDYLPEAVEREHNGRIGLLFQNVGGHFGELMRLSRNDGYGALNYLKPDYINLIGAATLENAEEIAVLKRRVAVLEEELERRVRA